MNRHVRLVAVMIAAASSLGGCTAARQVTGMENCNDPALIPAEQQICKDDATFNQTIAGGAFMGALIGAGGGAAGCALAGKNPAACAAVGAVGGAVAGGVGGYVVAKKQEASKNHIRAIDGVTADIRKQNEALSSQVVTARQVVDHAEQKLASVNAAVRAGTMSADQANAERARFARDSKRLGDIVEHLKKQEKEYEEAGQQIGEKNTDYNNQIVAMRANIATLQQQKSALDSAMAAG